LLHAIQIYEPRCKALGIEVRRSLDCSTEVVVRKGEMMQVISNLIANSIYAMPQGGTLSISIADAEGAADGVVVKVQDTGVGIPPEVLPKVFEAFFTTRSTVGTGIGLFIAKQFVEGHGGSMSAMSSTGSNDHGTTMEIRLPLKTTYDC
jgi:signal transduction histidine kinase